MRIVAETVESDLARAGEQHAPIAVVTRFLDLLAAKDLDAAAAMLRTDVEYVNVGFPTTRGRARVRWLLGATLGLAGAGF
jgi:limonene-1,2-epoxide hydrolase